MQAQQEVEQSQEAYVKGVSNWNFDVVALKASAAAEGPMLAPVPEGGPSAGAGDFQKLGPLLSGQASLQTVANRPGCCMLLTCG